MSATPEQIALIVAEAVKAALAAGAAKTPVPGSAAPWSQIVAAGPPTAPPPPQPTVLPPLAPDLVYTLNTVMGWHQTSGWKQPLVWKSVVTAYRAHPDYFKIMGGLHTSAEGDRTYFSVVYSPPAEPWDKFVIHLYGALRGNRFFVRDIDVFQGPHAYHSVVVCEPKKTPPQSEDGSVGGWDFCGE
jgi:hypothetical protein